MNKLYLKFSVLIVFLIHLSEVKAQYFGQEGTQWSYTVVRPGTTDRIITLESIGTEEILGKTCNVIQKNGNSCETLGPTTNYIYYEEGQVFWYNDSINDFTTLYNFNAMPGDSWVIHLRDCIVNVNIDSVSYDTFNGETLKVLYPDQSITGYQNFRIIERLGLEEFLFPNPGAIGCAAACEGSMIVDPIRCYQDDQFNYQSIDLEEECFMLTNTTNLKDQFELKILPSISSGEFKVEIDGDQNVKIDEISLVDLNGIEIQNHKLVDDNFKILNVQTNGMYILLVKLNNQMIRAEKIIVTK